MPIIMKKLLKIEFKIVSINILSVACEIKVLNQFENSSLFHILIVNIYNINFLITK